MYYNRQQLYHTHANKVYNTINTECYRGVDLSICALGKEAALLEMLRVLGRGSRILSDGVVGRDAVADDAVGVAIFNWVGRTGVRIDFFVSRSCSFSPPTFSLPFFLESRRRGSKPFSASPPGDSSSRAFRFRPHLSFVSLRDTSVSFCFI
jgi:hypothetical protein